MSSKRAVLASVLAALAASAAIAMPAVSTGEDRGGATASALVHWSGRWQTNFGKVKLSQSGRKVTGTYSHGRAHINGRAKGDTGRVLAGNWSQSGGRLRGTLRFTMSANHCKFTGSYKFSDGSPGGEWSGRRLSAAC
jgi:hypothetical protein